MKKLLLAVFVACMGASFAIAEGEIDDRRLIRKAQRMVRLLEREVSYLTPSEKRQVRRHIQQINRVLGGGNDPGPNRGYYCVAACKTYNGQPDLTYSAGASAEFEAQAEQAAREKVRSGFSCSYGITMHRCEREGRRDSQACSATCKTYNGQPDPTYSKSGVGSSLLEAAQRARSSVKQSFSCSYGITDHECSQTNEPHYCVAACKTYNGKADLTYSQGARGNSEVEAKVSAIEAVKSRFSCSYGIIVDSCEGR